MQSTVKNHDYSVHMNEILTNSLKRVGKISILRTFSAACSVVSEFVTISTIHCRGLSAMLSSVFQEPKKLSNVTGPCCQNPVPSYPPCCHTTRRQMNQSTSLLRTQTSMISWLCSTSCMWDGKFCFAFI